MTSYRFSKLATMPSQIYFHFPVLWRLTFRKVKNNYLCSKFQPISEWIADILLKTSGWQKQTVSILKFYSRFRCWLFFTIIGMRFCTGLAIFTRISDQRLSSDVISIFQDGGHAIANLLPFHGGMVTSHVSGGTKLSAYQMSTMQIFQSNADILLLPIPKSKRSPYLNSTLGFHIDFFTVVGMWLFCISLSKFVQLGWSTTELWRHIDFTRWRL